MQMQTYFVDDPTALDWEASTSFRVIDDIRTSNRSFFDLWAESGHPGIRAARLSRAGDAKMTAADIRAWDDLVLNELIPSVENRKLDRGSQEAGPPGCAILPACHCASDRTQGMDNPGSRSLHGSVSASHYLLNRGRMFKGTQQSAGCL
jgi:hypothetical protein